MAFCEGAGPGASPGGDTSDRFSLSLRSIKVMQRSFKPQKWERYPLEGLLVPMEMLIVL